MQKISSKLKNCFPKSPLKSFRRAYPEDFRDDFEPQGLFAHAATTFVTIFKNWKFFGGLLLVAVAFGVLFVGLMNQTSLETIKTSIANSADEFSSTGNLGNFAQAGLLLIATATSGGLTQDLSEGQGLILILIFLLLWLATTYFLRFEFAKKKVGLRDTIYNAFAPLASTLVVFVVILIELLPVFFTLIVYNSALETEFLKTPFYALLFVGFALLMITLSGFLVSSSIVALVAVSAPGLYPLEALKETYALMFRRRIKFIIRLLFLAVTVAFIFVVTMLPIILLDGLLKSAVEIFAGIPVVPFCLFTVSCFCFIFIATYLYLYYRRMLEYEPR